LFVPVAGGEYTCPEQKPSIVAGRFGFDKVLCVAVFGQVEAAGFWFGQRGCVRQIRAKLKFFDFVSALQTDLNGRPIVGYLSGQSPARFSSITQFPVSLKSTFVMKLLMSITPRP